MKLYSKTTKRIAKKKLRLRGRRYKGGRWEKLNYAKHLKPGDLVSTCKGYNERIKEITPEWGNQRLSKGSYVYDFDIVTESGSSCSVINCCTFPLETKDEIITYWDLYNTEEGKLWLKQMVEGGWSSDRSLSIAKALAEGREVFDDDGQPLPEFCADYERIARFGA